AVMRPTLFVGGGGVVGLRYVIEQPGGLGADGRRPVPEGRRDDERSGRLLTENVEPCEVGAIAIDPDLDVASETAPEVRLLRVTMPGLDNPRVLHGVVDLSLRREHTLELVHDRVTPVVAEVGRGQEDRFPGLQRVGVRVAGRPGQGRWAFDVHMPSFGRSGLLMKQSPACAGCAGAAR